MRICATNRKDTTGVHCSTAALLSRARPLVGSRSLIFYCPLANRWRMGGQLLLTFFI
jgi:hypothetical protein